MGFTHPCQVKFMIFFSLSPFYFFRTTSRNPYNSATHFPHGLSPLLRSSPRARVRIPPFPHSQPLRNNASRASSIFRPYFACAMSTHHPAPPRSSGTLPRFPLSRLSRLSRGPPLTKHAAHGIIFRHNGTALPCNHLAGKPKLQDIPDSQPPEPEGASRQSARHS